MTSLTLITAAVGASLALSALPALAQKVTTDPDATITESQKSGPASVERQTSSGAVIFSPEDRRRFRDFVLREPRPSYRYSGQFQVGAVLPEDGVTYYDVPAEYRVAPAYRYAYVNDRPVIIDRSSRRIVEIIE